MLTTPKNHDRTTNPFWIANMVVGLGKKNKAHIWKATGTQNK
jgi:hypothetical protein